MMNRNSYLPPSRVLSTIYFYKRVFSAKLNATTTIKHMAPKPLCTVQYVMSNFSFRAVSITLIPLGESYDFVGYTKIMLQLACEHS